MSPTELAVFAKLFLLNVSFTNIISCLVLNLISGMQMAALVTRS